MTLNLVSVDASLPLRAGGKSNSLDDAYQRGRRYLHDLAAVTGGRYFEANQNLCDLDQAVAHIAEELRRQYSLGYYPHPPGRPGERRRVRVRVERPDVAVNSRGSYILQSQPTTRKMRRPD